jgi:Sigma-70, region 4
MIGNTLEMRKNAVEIDTKRLGRIEKNIAVTTKEMGSELKKSVCRLQLVHVSRNVRRTELREGTTGRPIAASRGMNVPRIMAVAELLRAPVAQSQPAPSQPKVELAFYRKYSEAMLRRYMRISMQPGRTPSLLGRELFRGDASHTAMTTFEDGVIFCVDVERCLAKLRPLDRRLIQRIALQGHTPQEAAPLLGMSFRACYIHYYQGLDRLTEVLLASRLLEPSKCCQDVDEVEN